ncbi:MAG: hypothetical protein WD738_22050 [Pirellulales bacterium]
MNFTPFQSRFAAVAILLVGGMKAAACPFCSVESQTLSEETQSADAVVLAKLIKEAPPVTNEVGGLPPTDPDSGTATFEIVEVLKGQDRLSDAKEVRAVYFGEADRERVFLIMGLGSDKLDWTTPLPLSPAAVDYVRKLPSAAPTGADRLAFFQDYLEHEDPLLAQDAYDEFARAPYAEVQALGPRMHHDRLVKWISDLEISPSRRRLYFTMLSTCGGKDDLPLLESMIVSDFEAMEPHLQRLVSCGMAAGGPIGLPAWIELVQQDERRKKLGLDALVACYLTLRGPDGLDLIDERFLKNPSTEYTYVYSTIMALRFHGDEETGVLPRERLLASMRLLLENPDFADQVILDLSRWDDWSVLDRLVEMFKTSDKKGYVRQPIVTYLTVASEQPGDVGTRAAAALAELEQLDPKTVEQARNLMAFGALGRARAAGDAAGATRPAEGAVSNATEGFAASAADEETDTADMPDPAAYEAGDQASATAARETAQKAPVRPTAVNPAATRLSSPKSEAASPEAVPAELNRLLVVGVPLAAAVLLMGVYWLILRAGAV